MSNPWIETDGAFAPFFDESVIARSKDGKAVTIRAAVFSCNTGEPLDESLLETECDTLNLVVARCDWPYAKTLARGDSLEIDCKGKYKICTVNHDKQFGLVITARSV